MWPSPRGASALRDLGKGPQGGVYCRGVGKQLGNFRVKDDNI
jgi:hypothetical protein